jgi:hypothetical protein
MEGGRHIWHERAVFGLQKDHRLAIVCRASHPMMAPAVHVASG